MNYFGEIHFKKAYGISNNRLLYDNTDNNLRSIYIINNKFFGVFKRDSRKKCKALTKAKKTRQKTEARRSNKTLDPTLTSNYRTQTATLRSFCSKESRTPRRRSDRSRTSRRRWKPRTTWLMMPRERSLRASPNSLQSSKMSEDRPSCTLRPRKKWRRSKRRRRRIWRSHRRSWRSGRWLVF